MIERHLIETIPVYRWDDSVLYADAVQQQEDLVEQRQEALILCEHPETITLGTGASRSDLAYSTIHYERMGVTVCHSSRGGKATYHGPGQLVAYPILDLKKRGLTVHECLRLMEQVMIRVCADYEISAHTREGKSGAWVEERKIGFIGIRIRRGFSYHGISLNITPQREAFRLIVPCGMPDLHVTSLQEEARDSSLSVWQVADTLERCFFNLINE